MSEPKAIAVDNEDLREANLKKLAQGIENMGDGIKEAGNYFKDIKKSQKINLYLSIAWIIIILLFFGGVYMFAVVRAGSIDGIIDTDKITRRFNCTSAIANDTLRNYEDAIHFVDLYQGTCIVYDKRKLEERDA